MSGLRNTPPFWDPAGSHKHKFKINVDKIWKAKKINLMTFDEICISSFSSVSPKFWKISSQGARTRWELAETSKNFFFWKFFRGWKNGSKLHFSHFEWRFFINFASMLREFWPSGPRWGCILPESEERIEKFVDTAENEPRQKLQFSKFSIFRKIFLGVPST